jgi:signal transduction histidine kinase
MNQLAKASCAEASRSAITADFLLSLLDHARIAVWAVDRSLSLAFFNAYFSRGFCELVGNPPQVGMTIEQMFPPNSPQMREAWTALYQQVLMGETVHLEPEFEMSGRTEHFDVTLQPIQSGGEIVGVGGFSRNMTSQKAIESALRARENLLERLLTVEERDRKLIGFEIHDGLVQDATAALMHLQTCRAVSAPPPGRAGIEFELGLQLLRSSINEARRLISGLRPEVLDERGIVGALEEMAKSTARQSGMDVQFSPPESFARPSQFVEMALFRIAQEALTNASRHSKADHVRVSLWQTRHETRLEVVDDGVGFNPGEVSPGRFGLEGMRERARVLDGSVVIESRPGDGTRVVAALPTVEGAESDVELSVS